MAFGLGHLGRVGGEAPVLFVFYGAAFRDVAEHTAQERGGHGGEFAKERSRGAAAHRHFLLGVEGAAVEACRHAHDADADGLTSVHNGPLHGRCAAVGRQKGCMHVNRGEPGRIEHGLGQNHAVGRHHKEIRLIRLHELKRLFRLHGGRLMHGESLLQRQDLHGRRHKAPAASGFPVGAGEYGLHGKFRPPEKGGQNISGEGRGAHKNYFACFCLLSHFLTLLS